MTDQEHADAVFQGLRQLQVVVKNAEDHGLSVAFLNEHDAPLYLPDSVEVRRSETTYFTPTRVKGVS